MDSTDTGSLVGQGKLGDKMVVTGSKRRRVIFQCCMAAVLLILAFVLPLILKVPGLVPPRAAQALETKAVTLHTRIIARVPQADENGVVAMKRFVTTPGRMLIGECLPKNHKVPFDIINRLLTKREIGDVIEVEDELFEHPPNTLGRDVRELVRGVYKLDGQLLLILDATAAIQIAA